MTPRHDQQERLRALGLDASPAARRLRARIPRPAPEPAAGIPSAPYSVDAWPERDPGDRAPAPPDPDATRTVRTPPPRDPPPWTGARLPTDGTTQRLHPRPAGVSGPTSNGETAHTAAHPWNPHPYAGEAVVKRAHGAGRATDHPPPADARPRAEHPTPARSNSAHEPAPGNGTAPTRAEHAHDVGRSRGGPTDAAAHGTPTGTGATASSGRPRGEHPTAGWNSGARKPGPDNETAYTADRSPGHATAHPATADADQPRIERPIADWSSGAGEPATGGGTAPTPARPRGGRPHQGRATDHPATAATAQPWAEQPTANRSSGTGEPATGGET
ncbi:hypothetical protein ACJOT4_27760, partial [Nocardiopsis sp. frass4]